MTFYLFLFACGAVAASSAPVQGDMAIVQCQGKGVYALRSDDGTFAWNYDGDSEWSCVNYDDGFVTWNSSTVLTTCWNGDNMVVDALRITDGKRMWRSKTIEQVLSGSSRMTVLLDTATDNVFTVDIGRQVLTATNLASSKAVWQHNFSTMVEPLLTESVCMRLKRHPPYSCEESVRVLLTRSAEVDGSEERNPKLTLLDASNGTLYWSMNLMLNNFTDGTIAGKPVLKPNSTQIAVVMNDKDSMEEGNPVSLYTIDLRVKENTTEPTWVDIYRLAHNGGYYDSNGLVLSGDGNTLLIDTSPILTAVDANEPSPSSDLLDGYYWSRRFSSLPGLPITDAAGQKAFIIDYTIPRLSDPSSDPSSFTVNVFDFYAGDIFAGGKFHCDGSMVGSSIGSVSADGTTVYAVCATMSTVHLAMNTSSRKQLWNYTCPGASGASEKFV